MREELNQGPITSRLAHPFHNSPPQRLKLLVLCT
jgi:hypothetical protein